MHNNDQIGVLILHGFGGSASQMGKIATSIQSEKYVFDVVTFKGHADKLSKKALKKVQYMEWVSQACSAFEVLFENTKKVYVIGYSMGGVIASYLASKYQVEKAVFIAPAFHHISPKNLFFDIKAIINEYNDSKQHGHYYEKRMSHIPPEALNEFMLLVEHVKRVISLEPLQCKEALIIQGTNDAVVHTSSAEYLYERISTPDKQIIYNDSTHLIILDDHIEETNEKIKQFLAK